MNCPKLLSQLVTVEISPSDVSYTLSSLEPGSYNQVEVQAVNSIGMSSESIIFKTKESAPEQVVKEDEPEIQLSGQRSPSPTSPKLHVKVQAELLMDITDSEDTNSVIMEIIEPTTSETKPKDPKQRKTDKVENPRTELEFRQSWTNEVATSISLDEPCQLNQDHDEVPNVKQESLEDEGKPKAIFPYPGETKPKDPKQCKTDKVENPRTELEFRQSWTNEVATSISLDEPCQLNQDHDEVPNVKQESLEDEGKPKAIFPYPVQAELLMDITDSEDTNSVIIEIMEPSTSETKPKHPKQCKTDKVEDPRTDLEFRQWTNEVATSISLDEPCQLSQDHNEVPNVKQESLEDEGKPKAIFPYPVQAELLMDITDSEDTNSVIIEIMEPSTSETKPKDPKQCRKDEQEANRKSKTSTARLIATWFCVLMFSSVAGAYSVKKCANIGQGAQLFSVDNDYAEPSLYREPQIYIASWEGITYTVAHMDPQYSGKIYMDRKRNIWILALERKDAGKYYLKFGIQSERLEITLTVTEELTEEQPQECPNNCPDFTKEATDNPGCNMLGLLALLIIPVLAVIYVLYRKKILSCETTPKDPKQCKTDKVEVPRTELELRQWLNEVATSTSLDEPCRLNPDHNQVPNIMQELLDDEGKQNASVPNPVQAELLMDITDSEDTN